MQVSVQAYKKMKKKTKKKNKKQKHKPLYNTAQQDKTRARSPMTTRLIPFQTPHHTLYYRGAYFLCSEAESGCGGPTS